MNKLIKNGKIIITILATVLLCSVVFMGFSLANNQAEAYELLSWDLIDNGGHLDYDYSTKYSSTLGASINVWNAHKSGVIRPDSWKIIQDVFVSDYDDSSSDAAVAYCSSGGKIKLNDHYYVSMSAGERQKTMMHELGHALGLDENNSVTGSIMKQGIRSQTTLIQDDKDGYDASYLNYE
ncbi:MAG: matrixin family metalloprotease [Clostridia bacterium]